MCNMASMHVVARTLARDICCRNTDHCPTQTRFTAPRRAEHVRVALIE